MTSFLTSTLPNATFNSDASVLHTGEDFISAANSTADAPFIQISDLLEANSTADAPFISAADAPFIQICDVTTSVECSDPKVFHLLMRAAIEQFADIHFYHFGKLAAGDVDSRSCDMAWRFRPKDAKHAAFYKDYRRWMALDFASLKRRK